MAFGRNLIQGLINPSYAPGLMTVAEQAGAAQAVAQAAERQKEFDANSFKLLRQGLFSADQGDVTALANRTNDLVNMLNQTTDEKDRATLQNMITQLDAQRSATQATATSNTANSIIKTEQALEKLTSEMDPETGALPPQQQKVFDALTQRLNFMKQNSKAVVEADNIKYQTTFNKIKQDNLLAEQQKQAVQRKLSSVPFGSEDYERLAQEARDLNQGQAVDQFEKTQLELIEARARANEIRDSEQPLSQAEIEKLAEIGIVVPKNQTRLSIKSNRKSLANLEQAIETRRITLALRPIEGVEDVKAHVQTTLEMLRDSSDIPFDIFDLSGEISDLLDDPAEVSKIAGLIERPAGKEPTPEEVQEAVFSYIKQKFPEKFKEYQTYQEKVFKEQTNITQIRDDLLRLATDEETGKLLFSDAFDEDGNLDISKIPPRDLIRATLDAERRASMAGGLSATESAGNKRGLTTAGGALASSLREAFE